MPDFERLIKRSARLGLCAAVVFAVTACSAQFRNHGYVPDETDLAQITVGVDTRDTVAELVGTPSSTGVLDSSAYYYVQSQVRHYGWQAPEVVAREVVAVSFTESGIVENIGRYGLEDGQVVPLTRRVTRNEQDFGLIRRLFANVGRISAANVLNQ